jgi:glutamate racemase
VPLTGVFDSGVGGLSVLRDIRRQLPNQSLLYVADTAWCPYGPRPEEEVRARSHAIADELIRRGADSIVVACNTATAAAASSLRERLSVPVVGVEPAVKPAAAMTRSGVVGVLATESTLHGQRFAGLVQRFAEGVEVLTQACPGLVQLVERGELDGPLVDELVSSYVDPLLGHGADVLTLGCTHFPFLRASIEKAAGPNVTVLDTGAAVARQLERVLAERGLLASEPAPSEVWFLTSGEPGLVQPLMQRLWAQPLDVSALGV